MARRRRPVTSAPMDLERFIVALGPTEVVDQAPVEVRDLAYDTRSVTPGALFFCVRGASADGHDLAAAAIAAGAAALVVERRLEVTVPQLVVSDVRTAMPAAAVLFFGHPTRELEVAGITGTNGKTTTAFLLHSILAAAGRRPGLLTNIERLVGGAARATGLNTPEAIDLQRLFREMLDAGDRSCAIEATSIAQAKGRLCGTRFAVLAFTNLTQDHLDFHGSMEAYFDAKRALFAQADRAVVNVGDEYGRRLADELPDVVRFDATSDALDGIALKLRGDFNRENALAAVCAGRALGRGRLIVVFGAGGDRDRAKRPLMGGIASELADRVIVTTDNPRREDPSEIASEVAAGARHAVEIELDRRRAIEQAIEDARPGDVIVIAGKGADVEQEVGGRRVPFDDRVVAREALRRAAVQR